MRIFYIGMNDLFVVHCAAYLMKRMFLASNGSGQRYMHHRRTFAKFANEKHEMRPLNMGAITSYKGISTVIILKLFSIA